MWLVNKFALNNFLLFLMSKIALCIKDAFTLDQYENRGRFIRLIGSQKNKISELRSPSTTKDPGSVARKKISSTFEPEAKFLLSLLVFFQSVIKSDLRTSLHKKSFMANRVIALHANE